MEREIPRNQPESDVPELEVIRSQEDKEVIAEREIPLHEEMGFDSAAQMEQARAMQTALLKEKDMAKADQLRAELKALLDDSDGEPVAASDGQVIKERVMARAATSEAKYSAPVLEKPLRLVTKNAESSEDLAAEAAIAKLEHQEGMANAARRLEIDEVNNFLSSIAEAPDVAQADKLRSEMQAYLTRVDRYMGRSSRKLSKYSNGFDEQSRSQFDQLARERIAKVQSEIDESVAELTTPEAGSDETASEKLGRKKAEKQRRSYEESPTELYEPEEGREEA